MKKVLKDRFFEIVIIEIIISSLASLLQYCGLFENYQNVFFVGLGACGVYLIWTVYCLYNFRMAFDGPGIYYRVNIPSYVVLFLGSIIYANPANEPHYSYFFMPFKVFYYAKIAGYLPGNLPISRRVSAILLCLIIAVVFVVTPNLITGRVKKSIIDFFDDHNL